jgi:hypothetical protein
MNKNDAIREIIENHTGIKIDDKQAAGILDSWYTYLEQLSPLENKVIPISEKKDDLADLREMVDKILSRVGLRIDWRNEILIHRGSGIRLDKHYQAYWKHR